MKLCFPFPNVIYLDSQPYVCSLGNIANLWGLIATDDEFYIIIILSLISGKA